MLLAYLFPCPRASCWLGSRSKRCAIVHPPNTGAPLTACPALPPTCPAAGQPVLLPLTESLYVSGKLESVDTVLLEIGTGYYVEVRRYQSCFPVMQVTQRWVGSEGLWWLFEGRRVRNITAASTTSRVIRDWHRVLFGGEEQGRGGGRQQEQQWCSSVCGTRHPGWLPLAVPVCPACQAGKPLVLRGLWAQASSEDVHAVAPSAPPPITLPPTHLPPTLASHPCAA